MAFLQEFASAQQQEEFFPDAEQWSSVDVSEAYFCTLCSQDLVFYKFVVEMHLPPDVIQAVQARAEAGKPPGDELPILTWSLCLTCCRLVRTVAEIFCHDTSCGERIVPESCTFVQLMEPKVAYQFFSEFWKVNSEHWETSKVKVVDLVKVPECVGRGILELRS